VSIARYAPKAEEPAAQDRLDQQSSQPLPGVQPDFVDAEGTAEPAGTGGVTNGFVARVSISISNWK